MKLKLIFAFALLGVRLSAFEVEIANTGSMTPTMKGGEHHEVNMAVRFQDLKPGMIAVYTNPFLRLGGVMICHRIHHYQAKGFLHAAGWIMKGDANDRCDPGLMTEKNYIGVIFLPKN